MVPSMAAATSTVTELAQAPRPRPGVRQRVARWPVGFVAAVVLLLLLAAGLRIGYVLYSSDYIPRGDAHSYDMLARSLAGGHGWPGKQFGWAYRPPGYPFFLAGLYDLIGIPRGDDVTTVRIVQAILGTVTVLLVGLLARELWGRAAMLVALGLAALSFSLAVVGDSLLTESLFTPLVLAATLCALRSRRASFRYGWILAAALFAGMASLTRTNGMILAPALAAVVWSTKPHLRPRSLAAPIVFLLAMAATIAPWTIRNAVFLHAFVPVSVETGPTLAGTYNAAAASREWRWQLVYPNYRSITTNKHLTGPERDSKYTSAVLSYIGRHPYAVPEVVFWNTVRLLDLGGQEVYHKTASTDTEAAGSTADAIAYEFWGFAALAIIGILSGAARGTPRSLWLVPLALWLSVALVTAGTPRFRSALEPFVIGLAATGVLAVGRTLGARLRLR
jgi:4-amino-4-deoxy-L-arabinose transferase-like glycosyltransferase